MSTVAVPASAAEAVEIWMTSVGYLADLDAASLPAAALAGLLKGMEQADGGGRSGVGSDAGRL